MGFSPGYRASAETGLGERDFPPLAGGSVLAALGLSCAVLVQAILAFPSTQCAQRHPKTYVLGLLALLLVLAVSFVLVWFHKRLAKAAGALVEHLVPLMNVYMVVTFVAVVILAIRNF